MGDDKNDHDRTAEGIGEVIVLLLGKAHEPGKNSGDSITITKDGFLAAVIRLQRLKDHVEGLAEAHRKGD